MRDASFWILVAVVVVAVSWKALSFIKLWVAAARSSEAKLAQQRSDEIVLLREIKEALSRPADAETYAAFAKLQESDTAEIVTAIRERNVVQEKLTEGLTQVCATLVEVTEKNVKAVEDFRRAVLGGNSEDYVKWADGPDATERKNKEFRVQEMMKSRGINRSAAESLVDTGSVWNDFKVGR